VYGVYETYLGRGIVGGYMDSFGAIGEATARIGLRILAGESPEGLPPEEIQTQAFMVDWRQLRRWRLDEAGLPPGTLVHFEQLSLWDRYRQQILAVIAVVILQSALIVALLLQARRRRLAEESLREGEERYRNVVETQTELICRYLPDTTLTFVNDAYCRYFGRSRDELVGSRFIGLIPEPDRAAALKHVESIGLSPHAETYEHQGHAAGWQYRLAAMDRPRDPRCRGLGRRAPGHRARHHRPQDRGHGGRGAAQGSDGSRSSGSSPARWPTS
jgi:PAS domain S-box-containing protein